MSSQNIDSQPALVSIKRAAELTSLSRTMINRLRARHRFPQAVELGDRRVAFVAAELHAWIDERIAARKAA